MSSIRSATWFAFYHFWQLKKLRSILGPEITATLVSAFVLNRLDYCNTVFAAIPSSTIAALQRVQNAAARLVKGLSPRDHTTSALCDLHWLPIQHRISYKLCVLTHLVHTGNVPSYLIHLICLISLLPPQISLRESVSDQPGLTIMNHWQLGRSLANAVFPMLGLKLGTACPMQFRK